MLAFGRDGLFHRFGCHSFVLQDVSQVDLLLGETVLPKVGAFRQLSESLAPGLSALACTRVCRLDPEATLLLSCAMTAVLKCAWESEIIGVLYAS